MLLILLFDNYGYAIVCFKPTHSPFFSPQLLPFFSLSLFFITSYSFKKDLLSWYQKVTCMLPTQGRNQQSYAVMISMNQEQHRIIPLRVKQWDTYFHGNHSTLIRYKAFPIRGTSWPALEIQLTTKTSEVLVLEENPQLHITKLA